MKKKYTVAAVVLAAVMMFTGCSWDDITAKFVGDGATASGTATVSGGPIVMEDYDPAECVTLGNYKGVEVDCTVTSEEVQQQIDNVLMQHSTVEQIKKGKCKSGQSVNIDYTGKVDGKAVDGETAQDEMVQLGSSGHIDGFDDGITGMKPGEKKELKLKAPADYKTAEAAGKEIVYNITLNYIAGETKTPKLTDSFVKKNTDYKTVKQFKDAAEENLRTQKKNNAGNTALQKIVEDSKVNNMPATLKEAHKRQTDHSYRYNLQQYYGKDMDFNTLLGSMGMTKEIYEQQLDQQGENSAKTQLVFEAIAKKENIVCSDADVQAYVDSVISGAGAQGATIDSFRQQYEAMYGNYVSFDDFLKTSCVYERVMSLIESNLKLKE